jgi:4-amino-4-deoxy-L-arabinose transferase-like glycosyltransferase
MSALDETYERRKPAERATWIPAVSWQLAGLASVFSLAMVLNAWNLAQNGYGNTFYAAAVRSMTLSWHNFFFASYDPGGFITVDKPPVFLWAGALSARVFGYSTWSILLPSALAGAATVGLLWLIVRRYFGATAATIAGLALALSPISVAVNRLNLPEPFLILALVGAAGAVLRSLESRRWWAWTALAGFLVGVAFNTKMLDGWIPGPAFALAVIVGASTVSRASIRRLLAQLAVLGAVTLVVSASWMVVVDAWPASQRPYVGGSTNNSELNVALGYNGFGRVDGESQAGGGGGGGGGGARAAAPNFNQGQTLPNGSDGGPGQIPGGSANNVPNLPSQAAPGGSANNVPNPPSQAAPGGSANNVPNPPSQVARGGNGGVMGGIRGAGGIIGGIPGLFRMFDNANGGQIGWLLPFALGGGLVALWSWRRDPLRRAFAVLFLGWILLYGGVFSYAQGIYHSYYTSTMAPGVAALVGVGAVAVAKAVRRDRRWLIAAVALVGLTVWAQLQIAGRTPDFYGWVRPMTVVAALAGVVLIVALALRRLPIAGGMALSIAGLLLLPGAWSLSAAANSSLNSTLPQAGPQQGASGGSFGSQSFDSGASQLATWLSTHDDGSTTWQLVVSNSQNASRLIAEYGYSVMSLGGFMGSDNTISVDEFADLVSSGAVRYVMTGQGGVFGGGVIPRDGAVRADGSGRQGTMPGGSVGATSGPNAVMAAVQNACTLVTDAPSSYQSSLYDCSGQADALRQAG